jgi:hypothetical protein
MGSEDSVDTEQSMHSGARQISRRCHVLQTSHDVKLNGIEIFGCEADECCANALRSFFTDDPGKHIERGTNFCDLELQSNFLAHFCIE